MIKTAIKTERLLAHKTECLILFCLEEKKPSGKPAELDTKLKGIIGISLMVTLGGCGNTISGVGQDIQDVGTKVTAWQNEKPTEKVVEKKASK